MSLTPIPELDAWQKRAEAREEQRYKTLLDERLRCPICDEVGVWFVQHCTTLEGEYIEGPVAYCGGHGPSVKSDQGDPQSLLSLNSYGWLPDGSTWEGGFPSV